VQSKFLLAIHLDIVEVPHSVEALTSVLTVKLADEAKPFVLGSWLFGRAAFGLNRRLAMS